MCGIAGLIDLTQRRSADELLHAARAMAFRLRHRGPDDAHEWADADAGIAIGFRRLSIQDLSQGGRQPMRSLNGRYVVAFNGEVYNAPELKRELQADGLLFRGSSDTEVLVALIERDGFVGAVSALRGMFAIVCWDTQDRVLHLARDHFGKKPLYYGMHGDTFVFASEPKAFYALYGFGADIDRDALATFFRFGYIPAPQTIYRGLAKLQAGERVEVHGRRVVTHQFWSLDTCVADAGDNICALTDTEAADRLEALLGDAVERRLVSHVPLGAFLSGGIDSSIVAVLAQIRSGKRIDCFSIGFPEDAYDESRFAAAVADHIGAKHSVLQVTPSDLQAAIADMPFVYDEPFADPSQVPTTILSRFARQQVTVALSGDGGDELFRGYGRYAVFEQIMAGHRRLPRKIREPMASFLRAVPDPVWRVAGRAVPGRYGSSPLAARVRRLADMLATGQPELVYRDLVGQWQHVEALVHGAREQLPYTWSGRFSAYADDPAALGQLIDLSTYLPDDILQKVDRASMSTGLEVRAPLLDLDVVAFALTLPKHLLVRDGASKWLLRQVLYRHLPRRLVDRPKMGFGFPLAEWLRGPLAPWADDLIQSLSRSGLVDGDLIIARWNAHRAGQGDWSYRLWCALMFESWRRAHAAAATARFTVPDRGIENGHGVS